MSKTIIILILCVLATGCMPTQVATSAQSLSYETQISDCFGKELSGCDRLPQLQVSVLPVRVRAAVPGRASLFAQGLEQALTSSLSTCPRIRIQPSPGAASSLPRAELDITITQFHTQVQSQSSEFNAAAYVLNHNRSISKRDTWIADAHVSLRLIMPSGAERLLSWTATEFGQTHDDSRENSPLLALGTITTDSSQETSYSIVLCRLGHRVAVDVANHLPELFKQGDTK